MLQSSPNNNQLDNKSDLHVVQIMQKMHISNSQNTSTTVDVRNPKDYPTYDFLIETNKLILNEEIDEFELSIKVHVLKVP